jgi:hypothetical protein
MVNPAGRQIRVSWVWIQIQIFLNISYPYPYPLNPYPPWRVWISNVSGLGGDHDALGKYRSSHGNTQKKRSILVSHLLRTSSIHRKLASYVTNKDNISADKDETVKRMKRTADPGASEY